MPTPHTPVSSALPSSVNLVVDGDKRKAASIRPALETIINAIRHLQGIVAPSTTVAGSSPISRTYGEWQIDDNAIFQTGNGRVENDTTAANISERAELWTDLQLPHGCTLDSVQVYIDGAGTTLPAVPARVSVTQIDISTGFVTTLGFVDDPSASGAAFGAKHVISLTGIATVVDRIKVYRVRYLGHHNNGGGALTAGTLIWRPIVTITPATADQGAG